MIPPSLSAANGGGAGGAANAGNRRIYLLDYGAGNVRSLVNAVRRACGAEMTPIARPEDFAAADLVIFPGVGAFGQAMTALHAKGFVEPLLAYIASGKPFFGICVGLQVLFAGSAESPGARGLGVIPLAIEKFSDAAKTVPHMGWNGVVRTQQPATVAHDLVGCPIDDAARYYFVHSFACLWSAQNSDQLVKYMHAATRYGDQAFVAAVHFRNVFATQFHPEKSGQAGLALLQEYLRSATAVAPLPQRSASVSSLAPPTAAAVENGVTAPDQVPDLLAKRIIACLDVRADDQGQLVVTKGDQYDVRETEGNRDVRNLGDPVDLAARYCHQGADELAFLNITSFRSMPLQDLPMLALLKSASEQVFVPLTVGGGIRDFPQPDGSVVPALELVAEYFRSGADKVSIGSDAVLVAERLWSQVEPTSASRNSPRTAADLPEGDGTSPIEQIARVYGAQAVVVSVDPRRVYVKDASETSHTVLPLPEGILGPQGERFCWYQCTIKGGREGRDLDVHQLVAACERLGAGEVLLNCMDRDGTKSGFENVLISSVKSIARIPVIASSGAGNVAHFDEMFKVTGADAALAAGIFHRNEVPLPDVKQHLDRVGIPVRL